MSEIEITDKMVSAAVDEWLALDPDDGLQNNMRSVLRAAHTGCVVAEGWHEELKVEVFHDTSGEQPKGWYWTAPGVLNQGPFRTPEAAYRDASAGTLHYLGNHSATRPQLIAYLERIKRECLDVAYPILQINARIISVADLLSLLALARMAKP